MRRPNARMFTAQALATGTDNGTVIASRVASKAEGQEFSTLEQHKAEPCQKLTSVRKQPSQSLALPLLYVFHAVYDLLHKTGLIENTGTRKVGWLSAPPPVTTSDAHPACKSHGPYTCIFCRVCYKRYCASPTGNRETVKAGGHPGSCGY